MTISLSDAGKRYNRDWIFRNFNYRFTSGSSYAIVGPNGSGKSTLLQIISGAVELSEGKIVVQPESLAVSGESSIVSHQPEAKKMRSEIIVENIYQYISIAAPYLEVIEEMTVAEFLDFHQTFKTLLPLISIPEIIETVGLKNATKKQIRYYSSGMKQRVKLAQAIFSDVPVVLLDEPCTNLDGNGIALYQELIEKYCKERLVIVSSNDESEYGFCRERINMMEFK